MRSCDDVADDVCSSLVSLSRADNPIVASCTFEKAQMRPSCSHHLQDRLLVCTLYALSVHRASSSDGTATSVLSPNFVDQHLS